MQLFRPIVGIRLTKQVRFVSCGRIRHEFDGHYCSICVKVQIFCKILKTKAGKIEVFMTNLSAVMVNEKERNFWMIPEKA